MEVNFARHTQNLATRYTLPPAPRRYYVFCKQGSYTDKKLVLHLNCIKSWWELRSNFAIAWNTFRIRLCRKRIIASPQATRSAKFCEVLKADFFGVQCSNLKRTNVFCLPEGYWFNGKTANEVAPMVHYSIEHYRNLPNFRTVRISSLHTDNCDRQIRTVSCCGPFLYWWFYRILIQSSYTSSLQVIRWSCAMPRSSLPSEKCRIGMFYSFQIWGR